MFEERVLVTGATGFVGRATVRSLILEGYDVIQATRNAEIAKCNSSFTQVDLSKPETVMNLLNGNKYHVIVHLGAHIDLSEVSGEEMFLQNSLATGYLAYVAKKWNAYFVYASTAIVHGARSQIINKESPIILDTAYAKTKWLGEEVVRASQIKHLTLRIGGIYGLNGPNYLKLNNSIDQALRGVLPVLQGSGAALRNYIYVEDVARSIVYAIKNQVSGIHLLAGLEKLSIKDMAYQICDVFMPGSNPIMMDGVETKNQVIECSEDFPLPVKFKQSLEDIKKKNLE